jgi:chorismate-pyruvate lyase
MRERWFAFLLARPVGATFYLKDHFPQARFHLEKRIIRGSKMYRWIRFDLDGKTIVRARSTIDMALTNPRVAKLLRTTDEPIGSIVKKFHVKRTRLKSTTRSRSFHFLGDLHARVHERFYHLPKSAAANG